MKETGQKSRLRDIPRGIWALGFVSMLMDISSEMIHALLPVYLVVGLGASMAMVGLIEGIAEATASVVKIFSGAISDWLGRRKLLAIIGYGLAAVTKPIFPLATSIGWVVGARFVDRIGKGIRGAPRDALVADLSPPHLRGASFGLRQSLDTVGAFIGPAIAMLLMWYTADHFQSVFWVAVIPAFLALAVLVLFVREPPAPARPRTLSFPLRREQIARLGKAFWLVIMVASVFTLARFSEAFLILRAQAAGLPIALVPLVLVLMNVAYAMTAYPAGVLSDRYNRLHVLGVGFVMLILADLCLGFFDGMLGIIAGVLLFGAHMGFTQGIFATLVADTAPDDLRGTAFGIFNLMTGFALLLASLMAGLLWDAFGPAATFLTGAALATAAILGLALLHQAVPGIGETKT